MCERLSFIVGRPSAIDVLAAHGGLEWRRVPGLHRIGRLHVIVTVDEHGRTSASMPPIGVNDRMAGGRHDPHLIEAGAAQVRGEPFGTVADILRMFGLRAYGREANELFSFGHEPCALSSRVCQAR